MNRIFKKPVTAATVAVMAAAIGLGGQAAFAQGQQPGAPSADVLVFNACTPTNYADVVAKSLSITPVELRKDVVSGQTLQEIATSKNVDPQTVNAAVQAARQAAIDQAVTDGTLTQDEATLLKTRGAGGPQAGNRPQGAPQGNTAPGGNANPQGNGAQQNNRQPDFQTQLPDIGNLRGMLQLNTANGTGRRGGFGGFGGQGSFNVVKPYDVAAQALNLTCANLVKILVSTSGKTIAAVAADQKVDTKVVTDALTKAYKDALAQDVTDSIITQAQSDQVSANLDKAVAAFINNANGLRRGPAAPQGQ